jgi:hypothetical protein
MTNAEIIWLLVCVFIGVQMSHFGFKGVFVAMIFVAIATMGLRGFGVLP